MQEYDYSKEEFDEKTLKALETYEKFNKFLKIYTDVRPKKDEKDNLDQKQDPIEYMQKSFKELEENLLKKLFVVKIRRIADYDKIKEDYEQFAKYMEQWTKFGKTDLTNTISRASRNEITRIISASFDKNFDKKQMDFVAIVKNFGLYKSVNAIQKGSKKTNALIHYDVSKEEYEEALKNVNDNEALVSRKNYEDKKDYYGETSEIVYIASGILKMDPEQVEKHLIKINEVKAHNIKKSDADKRYNSCTKKPNDYVTQTVKDLIKENKEMEGQLTTKIVEMANEKNASGENFSPEDQEKLNQLLLKRNEIVNKLKEAQKNEVQQIIWGVKADLTRANIELPPQDLNRYMKSYFENHNFMGINSEKIKDGQESKPNGDNDKDER